MARLAKAPVRGLMTQFGAKLVAKDAIDKLIEFLESEITRLTTKAVGLCKHTGRKKVMKKDIELAIIQ